MEKVIVKETKKLHIIEKTEYLLCSDGIIRQIPYVYIDLGPILDVAKKQAMSEND